MRRLPWLALGLLASLSLSCGGGAAAQTVLLVTVDAPAPVVGARRLRVTVSNAGDSVVLQYPAAAAATADMSFPTTFSVGLSKSRMGEVDLRVDAVGMDGTAVVATGTAMVTSPMIGKENDVTVTIVPPSFAVTVMKAGTGTGKVVSMPAGIDCGATCTATFGGGATVLLTATPDPGSVFSGWTGGCTADPCNVTGNGAVSVTASFDTSSPLDVTIQGTGMGTVMSSPVGIDCGVAGGSCSHDFPKNSVVALTATEDAASAFTGWSGDCAAAGTMKTCNVTMAGARSATATFTVVTNHLTVMKTGSGQGTVSSTPAGISCGATCEADFAKNTVVTLRAQAQMGTAGGPPGSYFAFWQGVCTGSFHDCTVPMDQARSVTAAFFTQDFNTVFVTSGKFSGADIGGLIGARDKCNAAAQAAGLSGTYQPWLSTAGGVAPGVNAGTVMGAARGFVRLDAKPFADDVGSIVNNNQIWNPIHFDENGNDVGDDAVWTGTLANGTASPTGTCDNWTSTANQGIAGKTLGGPAAWTNASVFACTDLKRLYCFMTDRTGQALVPPVGGGKIVFLTKNDFTPGNGTPDALCQQDATANGLAGTFKALIATSSSAASTLLTSTIGYLRRDSIFVGTGGELSSSMAIRSGIWQFGDQLYPGGSPRVWTGSTAPGVVGDLTSTCGNWASAVGNGQVGFASTAGPGWWRDIVQPCNQPAKLYCIQQ